jgi:hypothetical protein
MPNPKKIFVTRRIPEIAFKMLKEKGYEVDLGTYKVPPTSKDLIKFFNTI